MKLKRQSAEQLMKKLQSLSFEKLRPEMLFVSFASLFGLIILFITPPFQTPDEFNHFYRAYQISEGGLISVKHDDRIGGYLPESLKNISGPFSGMCWNMHVKTNFDAIKTEFDVPLDADKRVFIDFPNTGLYSPVSYLPQSVSIFILRKLNLPPLYIFYGARIFTLFFWIIGIFIAIKIIPVYKWFFTLAALLPMSLFVNMSLSADAVTNLLSFNLIAYILKLAYSERGILIRDFIVTAVLVLFLASSKFVYVPIIALFILIPKRKFRSTTSYYGQIIALVIITFGAILFWSKLMEDLYIPYSQYNENFRDIVTILPCANMHDQMEYILNNGIYLLRVFVNSMIHTSSMYFHGYIGTFGWLDAKLPIWFIYFSYAILITVALGDKHKSITIKFKHKLLIVIAAITSISLILLAQHLTWDCVGGDRVYTIQGRYFIPLFPLLFLLFYSVKINFSKLIAPIIILFSFFSTFLTVYTLYGRYYHTPSYESFTIKCDAEEITENNSFVTSIPDIYLDNGDTRSEEKARSGKYSAKLTPTNQFTFTYRLYNCRRGDIINIDVWRFGKRGSIIIAGDKNKLYLSKYDPVETDSLGWEHLQWHFTVPKDMKNKEIGIYIYNDSKDSSYFDDMTIHYKKFQ